ncbi:unnamed protein product [Effrenium voratum]|nr:unnamed protein product [Effrenium voratum]
MDGSAATYVPRSATLARPRVALDVDEVLCRTAEAFCTWQTGQPGMDLTECFQRCYSHDASAMREQFLCSDFSLMAEPVQGSQEALQQLKAAGFELHAVTSRPGSCKTSSERFLARCFPALISGLHFASSTGPSKGQLCRQLEAVVLVDDQLQNVMDAVAHGVRCVVLDLHGQYAWNHGAVPGDSIRLHSWPEVASFLIGSSGSNSHVPASAASHASHFVPQTHSEFGGGSVPNSFAQTSQNGYTAPVPLPPTASMPSPSPQPQLPITAYALGQGPLGPSSLPQTAKQELQTQQLRLSEVVPQTLGPSSVPQTAVPQTALPQTAYSTGTREVVFKPRQPLGIFVSDLKNGHVSHVLEGQAMEQGLEPYFVMVAIDGQPYSEGLLEQKKNGNVPYRVGGKEVERLPAPAAPAAPAEPARACLVCTSSHTVKVDALPLGRRSIPLQPHTRVGREHQQAFFEAVLGQESPYWTAISRTHLELAEVAQGSFSIRNLSVNHIMVAGRQLQRGEQGSVQVNNSIDFLAVPPGAAASAVPQCFLRLELVSEDTSTPQAPPARAPGFWLEVSGSAVLQTSARKVHAGPDGKIVIGRAWQYELHKKALREEVQTFVSREHFRVEEQRQAVNAVFPQKPLLRLTALSANPIWLQRAGQLQQLSKEDADRRHRRRSCGCGCGRLHPAVHRRQQRIAGGAWICRLAAVAGRRGLRAGEALAAGCSATHGMHLAQVQAKAELVRLREQVAIAEEQEADVQERLAASEERVAALRQKLRDLRKEPSLSFLQLASDSKTDSESELRETQEKLSKEEDRAEVTRLLLLDQKRRVASEKNKLELLQNLQKRMEATAKERQRVLVATHRLLDTPIFDNSYAAASPAREPAPSQEQSTQDREKHVAVGRALENAKLARAQTEQLSALVAEQGDKLKEMKAKAAESQKEFEKLQKERQRLEDSLRRSKELRHSDATFAALKRLQEAQATLKEKEKELESAHQEIDKAKEHLEQKHAALKKEQERTQQLESQVAEADAKVEVLGKEEQKMEERRKELEDEKRTLQEVKRMDKEYEDLEVQAVQENVTLQTVQKQLMEEQQRTQELAERSRQQLEEEQQRAEAEASEAEEELAEAKVEEDAEFKGQEATLERKFKAEQAALQKQFEENEAATEEREKKKAFYALEIRAAEDMAKAHRKKIREDEEARGRKPHARAPAAGKFTGDPDAQTELKQLQDELAHETDAEKKRLAEHQYQAAVLEFVQ